jgi:putative SOS response-associated peptidase YedK
MCGRYTLTRQDGVVEELEARLTVQASPWWKPRFNIAPTQPAPVAHLLDGERVLALMRWGLVPAWANRAFLPGEPRPPLMINARAESIEAKGVFREAFHRHRCLVPADGFFEWLHGDGRAKPDPVYLHPVPRRVVAFAGVWVRAGELLSFAIVTTRPNALVAPIHDRQPVVIPHEDYATWLDPDTDLHVARAMLHAPPVADWRADPVSRHVNDAHHDDPACIELAPPVQGSLF